MIARNPVTFIPSFCSYRLRLSKISNICLLLLGFSLFIRIFISGNPWFSAWLFYINSCTTILFPPESARALHFAFICPYAKHIFAIYAYAVLHFSGFTPPFPPFFTSDSSFLVYLVHLCLSSAHHWHTHRVFPSFRMPRLFPWLRPIHMIIWIKECRCGGMVDTGDLKSPGSDTVRVRVPSAAPTYFITSLFYGWL